ncbi:MAG: sulfotransferase family protein [Sulfitobacter sp.]
MSRLPDFVVLGQGKAGTSLIYRVFQKNPDTGLSRPKELLFYNQHFDKGLEWYLSHFAHLDAQIARVGEVCPAYLEADAITRIHETLGPKAQMIYVLRHPIEQAYSRYLQNICGARGARAVKFDAAKVLRTRFDQLHSALQTLYRLYPAEQILSLSYERDIDVPLPGFEARICDFLGLPRRDLMARFRKRGNVNAGVMPRFIHGGVAGLDLECDGQSYHIPAQELVFCAQPRNSKSFGAVSAETAQAAQTRAQSWTSGVAQGAFAQLQEDLVLPFAARLETDFGLDMSHWQRPAQDISYELAPPPGDYMVEGSA